MQKGQLLPKRHDVRQVDDDTLVEASGATLKTRDHGVIRQWASRRGAEPATGEATPSGPATVAIADTGAGIRFNFPGLGPFRPIAWDEWFANFDQHQLAFVYEDAAGEGAALSYRYRIVPASDLSRESMTVKALRSSIHPCSLCRKVRGRRCFEHFPRFVPGSAHHGDARPVDSQHIE